VATSSKTAKRGPGRPAGGAQDWIMLKFGLLPDDREQLAGLSQRTGETEASILRRALRALLKREATNLGRASKGAL